MPERPRDLVQYDRYHILIGDDGGRRSIKVCERFLYLFNGKRLEYMRSVSPAEQKSYLKAFRPHLYREFYGR